MHVGYWENIDNQRNFFDEMAREFDFDPLVPENWLQVKASDVASRVVWIALLFIIISWLLIFISQGGQKIISCYGNSRIDFFFFWFLRNS